MTGRLRYLVLGISLGAWVFPALGNAAAPAADGFYARPAIFSTRPSESTELIQSVDRFGPVGIGIELHQPAFVMKVKNVEGGSPAEATGMLKPGQVIASINGETLKDIDPRIQLGGIITKAEATDGKVVLAVRENDEAPIQKVTVTIPVLGAYSESWPVDCKKSDKIVRDLADHLIEQGWHGGINMHGQLMMFLLSTGEEKDLDVVREWVKKTNFGGSHNYAWFVGWGAAPIAEYYLRTGDESVLPGMQKIVDGVRKTMYHDGWAGRAMAAHQMGIAGTGVLEFLLLARQCGIEVEAGMLQAALPHFYRHAGKGVNPYFDGRPEGGFTDNGKNGRLAFAMAAAVGLDPAGEEGVYAKARDIAAMHSFYSTSYMLQGHTGGGIGEVWRSEAMGLMIDKKPAQYRSFMDSRSWWYDLSRRYDGSFGVLGGGGYDGKHVGWVAPAIGLTYTAPRKQLVIFGAKSKYAKPYKIPARPWGTAADDDFLKLDAVPAQDGNVESYDHETVEEDSGMPMIRRFADRQASDEELLKLARHPQHAFRSLAAGKIYEGKRFHLIPQLLKDKDARVRYVGLLSMPMPVVSRHPERCKPGFPQDKVTPEILTLLLGMLNNPEESWFVLDQVLTQLSRRSAEELAPHTDRIISFLNHQEEWLRHGALGTLAPLAVRKETYKKVLAAMEREVPSFVRAPSGLGAVSKKLADADPAIQKAALKTLGNIYLAYPGRSANPPGGRHPLSESWYLNAMVGCIQAAPGGLDTLYEVSKKRFPDQILPYSGRYLGAANLDDSPKMKKALQAIIIEELVPAHVGRNWPHLVNAAAGGSLGGYGEVIDQLVSLYERGGVEGYGWTAFGADRHDYEWEYFSFDPKEEGPQWAAERTSRYRTVTYPEGMENWFAKDFDAKAAGWKKGKAPIAHYDGKLPGAGEYLGKACTSAICGCGDAGRTFWEKEVILMRRTFDLPPLQEGYRYRLLVGGFAHVYTGEGYCIYVNGRKIAEAKAYAGRGSGGSPKGAGIAPDFFDEFKGGKVVVAATSFLRGHQRTHKIHGNMNLWFEQQKIPPFTEKQLHKSATLFPMVSSDWQAMQDPTKTNLGPDEGKFSYNGTFQADKKLVGDWQVVAVVASANAYIPGMTSDIKRAPFRSVSLKQDGSTDTIDRLWTGDTLMHLGRNSRGGAAYQALKMAFKRIDGADTLFIEAGGFNAEFGPDLKCPVLVLTRK